ncbi:hypothetical protein ACFLQL_00195 [Verrucomicrobiota bacterium]
MTAFITIDNTQLIIPSNLNCNSIGKFRRNLILLYGQFLELTRQIYSTADNSMLGLDLIWNKDPINSKIWIDTEYMWEDKTPDFRPAIYVSLQGLKSSKLSLMAGTISKNIKEGEVTYGKEVTGTVMWVHIGRSKGETLNMLSNTYEYVDALAPIIKGEYCLDLFEVTDVTPLRVYREEKDHLRGELMAKFAFAETWTLKLESPKLKQLNTIITGQE